MNTIGALQFKEQCLELLDNLDDEGLVVTKHGVAGRARSFLTAMHDGDPDRQFAG